MAKILGKVHIQIGGKHIASLPGAALDVGGTKRTVKMSDRGYDGVSSEEMPSDVTCKIHCKKEGVTLPELHAMEEVTLVFEGDNGITYNIAKASNLDPPKITGQSGEVDLHFGGSPAELSS